MMDKVDFLQGLLDIAEARSESAALIMGDFYRRQGEITEDEWEAFVALLKGRKAREEPINLLEMLEQYDAMKAERDMLRAERDTLAEEKDRLEREALAREAPGEGIIGPREEGVLK